MLFFVGFLIVVGSILGGYMPHGDIRMLWQPLEILIILGSGIGGFVIANPGPVQKGVLSHIKVVLRGSPHGKEAYLELLSMLYALFKLAKGKGMLALEAHLENPHKSELFQRFPRFIANHHAVDFLCDYLRLLTLGADNPMEIEALMIEDLDTHHAEMEKLAGAVQTMAEALPAFGIVAAVLGIIIPMSSISEPPEIHGKLIAAALAGTFMGVLFCYGFFLPIAHSMRGYFEADSKYIGCLKAGLLSFMQGHAPAVAVEFARKSLYSHERPSFGEVEDAVGALPSNPG